MLRRPLACFSLGIAVLLTAGSVRAEDLFLAAGSELPGKIGIPRNSSAQMQPTLHMSMAAS